MKSSNTGPAADRCQADRPHPTLELPTTVADSPTVLAAAPVQPGRLVFPAHMADLRRSGLSEEMIGRMGVRSLTAAVLQRELLGQESGGTGDGYAIPYLELDGSPLLKSGRPVVRYRIFRDAGDQGPKYMAPLGDSWAIYLPPGLGELLADPARLLLVTEGEKKAAKAVQDGYACVGIAGVWMWHDPDHERPGGERCNPETLIHPTFQNLCLGRKVYVLADSDAAENSQVAYAMKLLARAIRVQVKTKGVYYAPLSTPQSPPPSPIEGSEN